MQILGLTLLFLAVLVLQGLVLIEAFGTSPGTQIQLNASHPAVWVTAVPEFAPTATRRPWWAPTWLA